MVTPNFRHRATGVVAGALAALGTLWGCQRDTAIEPGSLANTSINNAPMASAAQLAAIEIPRFDVGKGRCTSVQGIPPEHGAKGIRFAQAVWEQGSAFRRISIGIDTAGSAVYYDDARLGPNGVTLHIDRSRDIAYLMQLLPGSVKVLRMPPARVLNAGNFGDPTSVIAEVVIKCAQYFQ